MELLLLLFLIVLNGLFAMSEIAVVSARKARLKVRADAGQQSADVALALQERPAGFLSTIQVGITSIGILSGAIGENALAQPIAETLAGVPLLAPYSSGLALALVVILITYFSVVVGELVPKRLALLAPESIAGLVARPMTWLAAAARPLVWLLSRSSDLLVRLLGAHAREEPPVSDEEIRVLMEQGAEAGVFHASEQALVANVLRLDEQHINEIMTPRKDVTYVDLHGSAEEIRQRILSNPHAHILVCEGGLEQIAGVLRTNDLVKSVLAGNRLDIRAVMRQPAYIPDSSTITNLFEQFRQTRTQLACIVDEYGDLTGVVTVTDVLEAIVGELPDGNDTDPPELVQRSDGTWLLDGSMTIQRFKDAFHLSRLDDEAEDDYYTMGGFTMHQLGKVPEAADTFQCAGLQFEVLDMDGSRVDKLLVTPLSVPDSEPDGTP